MRKNTGSQEVRKSGRAEKAEEQRIRRKEEKKKNQGSGGGGHWSFVKKSV